MCQNMMKCVYLMLMCSAVFCTDFTFDLVKNAEECFYEVIKENVLCSLEFQVVSGGQLDVDVIIEGPSQRVIYKELRKEFDTFNFNTTETGEYMICFSNQFSTFTDKSIYISFESGKKNRLLNQMEEHKNEMTFMESTASGIYDFLEDVINGQTHYRLQESHGRRYAVELNDRVLWWSISQTFLIVSIGISQVLILRKFFNR